MFSSVTCISKYMQVHILVCIWLRLCNDRIPFIRKDDFSVSKHLCLLTMYCDCAYWEKGLSSVPSLCIPLCFVLKDLIFYKCLKSRFLYGKWLAPILSMLGYVKSRIHGNDKATSRYYLLFSERRLGLSNFR